MTPRPHYDMEMRPDGYRAGELIDVYAWNERSHAYCDHVGEFEGWDAAEDWVEEQEWLDSREAAE